MNTLEKLDKVDLQILRTLQSNARLTTKELAASVSLSSTPVFERLKRLENGMLQHIGELRLPAEDPCAEYEVLPGIYPERVRHDRQSRLARKHLCDGRGEA